MVQPHNRVGIVLAGGKGTRLYPLTKVVSKQLLPVYNKPVIYYPIETLIQTGHQQIIIITKPEDKELFKELILSNEEWNCEFIFLVQEEPKGLPDAFNVAHDYIVNKPSTLILGDNIILNVDFSKINFNDYDNTYIFLYRVKEPEKYGIVTIENKKIKSIEEKPIKTKSNFAAIGLYLFESNVNKRIKYLIPSKRNEIEIVDLISTSLKENRLKFFLFEKETKWFDIGDFENLHKANCFIRNTIS